MGVELFHADRQADRRTDGWKDRHDEANSRFSQFCERAQKRVNPVFQVILQVSIITTTCFGLFLGHHQVVTQRSIIQQNYYFSEYYGRCSASRVVDKTRDTKHLP